MFFLKSGDFGEFASFVTHMKKIAIVGILSFCRSNTDFFSHRRRTSTCYWSTLVTSTMVRDAFPSLFVLWGLIHCIGTGLSDAFPPGGVDAHDVSCVSFAEPWSESDRK